MNNVKKVYFRNESPNNCHVLQSDKYDDIYFDSDEEDGEQRKVKTNDELFYDPNMDDEDQTWVDDVR